MLNRRSLFRSGAFALGAAALPLDLLSAAAPPPRIPGWLELDRNENPHGPSPAARKAIAAAVDRGNRYLDREELDSFRDRIARFEGVTRDHVVLGFGSSEILWMAAEAFLKPGDRFVLGHPTYELIGRCAERIGATLDRINVTPEQRDDLDAYAKALNENVKLVYVCWPNNPCGSMHAPADVRTLVSAAAKRAPVLVDEAYLEYADPDLKTSMASLVRSGGNVIVARTFSKIHGLAGMRMGYAIAQPETAKRLMSQRFSVLNSLALAAASAALEDRDFVRMAKKRNDEARAIAVGAFENAGIRYVPSSTSFIWFDVSRHERLPERLAEHQIRMPSGRFTGGWNRITVGTSEEMERFAEAMKKM